MQKEQETYYLGQTDSQFPLKVKTQFYLGDRLEVMNGIGAGSVDFIFTSPPYNVGIGYNNHHDLMPFGEYLGFLNDTWKAAVRLLKTGGRIAINIPSVTYNGNYCPLYNDVMNQLLALNLIMRSEILWHKHQISKRTAWGSWKSPSNPYVVQPYEFILVFSKGTKKHEGKKENIDITKDEFIQYSNSLWDIKPETALSKNHPAPFPRELVYRLLKFYTYKGDMVLDMFGGSGTTAYVANQIERRAIYIDNCLEYYEFAKRRIDTNELFP